MARLYLVPTPIGNLKAVTFPAIRTGGAASLILAEDTRHTRRLLRHYSISTPLLSYHCPNGHGVTMEEGLPAARHACSS